MRIYTEQRSLAFWQAHGWKVPDESEAFPGDVAAIVIREAGHDVLVQASFGFVPRVSAASPLAQKKLQNARSETVFSKPSFARAARENRCVVPVTGFYEQDNRRWLRYTTQEHRMLMAGIYAEPHGGSPVRSFSVLTCESNALIYPVNDRMPVILSEEGMELWLNPATSQEELEALFVALPSEAFLVEDAGSTLRRKKPLEQAPLLLDF